VAERATQGEASSGLRAALLGLVFFVSGSSGLIYEVAWTRTIRLFVGSTTLSHTIVLAAFMGGLALGAWIAGGRADRAARPLRVYGILELAIGAYGLLVPFLVRALGPALGALYRACEGRPWAFALGELLVLGPVILPGSALMGATLPVLGRAIARARAAPGGVARDGGWLYAVNTLGAAIGAALAGFELLPLLGLTATTLVAALTNGALAAGVFAIEGRWPGESHWFSGASPPKSPRHGGTSRPPERSELRSPPCGGEPPPSAALARPLGDASRANSFEIERDPRASTADDEDDASGAPRAAALAIALTGLAGMTLQIAWTKLFVTSAGSSTFAFTGVVAVYILGIGAGAALGTRLLSLKTNSARLLAGAAIGSAVAAAFTVPFFAYLPGRVAELTVERIQQLMSEDLAPVLAWECVFLAVGLGPATVCLGATFPLGVAVAGGSPHRPGRALGRISAASSLGSIAGALGGGLVLLPVFGLTGALRLAALLMGGAGLVALGVAPGGRRARATWGLGALATLVVLVLTLPGPDARILDSGAYLFRGSQRVQEARKRAQSRGETADALEPVRRPDRLVKHGEGDDLVAAVYSTGYDEYLVINGKVDASSHADAETQLLVAHITMLLHGPGAKNVCVIGLGSGMTTGAVLAHPGVERVDLVEISPTVVETVRSSRLFGFLSHGALDDPRTRLLLADGRTHLWHASERYDVIVSEPTNPWIAGVGDLYTREHFARVKERLAPGGVVGQWLQGYSTTPELFKTLVRTFRSVFPDVQIWRFAQGEDFLLVARREGGELSMKLADVKSVASGNERLLESLEEANVFSPSSFFWFFSLDSAGVRELVGEGEENTDDSGYLEFHAPAALFRDAFPLDEPSAVALADNARSPFPDGSDEELARVRALKQDYYRACRLRRYDRSGALVEADGILKRIIEKAPPPATFVKSERAAVLAERLLREELTDGETVRAALDDMAEVPLRSARVLASYASSAWKVGEVGRAETAYRRVLELRPFWDEGRTRLATILIARRDWSEALEVLAKVATPTGESLALEGAAQAGLNRPDAARAAYERAVALDPSASKAWTGLGRLRAQANDLAGAREAYSRAVEGEPKIAAAWFNLAAASYALHDLERAREACTRALALDPKDERVRALARELGLAQ
jgi:spermidine synthase/tetratricopeptide (TPR) repeat protein/MFS family permease